MAGSNESKDFYSFAFLTILSGSGMRIAFAAIISLIICLLSVGCYAQSMNYPQSVGGDFGRNWIGSFKPKIPNQRSRILKMTSGHGAAHLKEA
jgi:hypothetical protein